MQLLIGTWFVCASNFPMWTSGGKMHPTFNYHLTEKKGQVVLHDEVKFVKKGKSKSIVGYDYQDAEDPSKFRWRGKGWLAIAKSNWQVVLKDPHKNWVVIHFSKTLFTPEGVDIICRQPELKAAEIEEIKIQMLEHPLLRGQVAGLKSIEQKVW